MGLHLQVALDGVRYKKAISFEYRGVRRVVAPHAVGVGHDGRASLSAYLIDGKPLIRGNYWLYCALDDLTNVRLEADDFSNAQPGYTLNDTRFQRFFATL